jgi:hypothetical protein
MQAKGAPAGPRWPDESVVLDWRGLQRARGSRKIVGSRERAALGIGARRASERRERSGRDEALTARRRVFQQLNADG